MKPSVDENPEPGSADFVGRSCRSLAKAAHQLYIALSEHYVACFVACIPEPAEKQCADWLIV